eukprot:scaffold8457_cov112-Isochrysis_galbana.AAC.7
MGGASCPMHYLPCLTRPTRLNRHVPVRLEALRFANANAGSEASSFSHSPLRHRSECCCWVPAGRFAQVARGRRSVMSSASPVELRGFVPVCNLPVGASCLL